MSTAGLLAGRTAIVTGASRGIGAATAVALAQAGAAVGLLARDPAALARLATRLGDEGTCAVAVRTADVADAPSLRAAIDALTGDLGAPSILVNNAGAIDRSPTETTSAGSWRRVLDTNLGGAVTASTAVLGAMRDLGGGSIVNIASLSAHFGVRRAASYGASKSALLGLTRALALEWAADGIRVNAVTPGYIATDLTAPLTADPERSAGIVSRIPLGRWGSPEDVAGTVVYLCSDLAAYVTGQVVVVDGGYSVDG
ncbi:SDR family NAD(P)-dependent oxidoreductase [Blastococcus sp. SYSU D00820]